MCNVETHAGYRCGPSCHHEQQRACRAGNGQGLAACKTHRVINGQVRRLLEYNCYGRLAFLTPFGRNHGVSLMNRTVATVE
jgi:hypothetical protein